MERSSTSISITSPPIIAFSSSAVPSAMMWPASITLMRSARRSASSMYCVVSTIVVPSLLSSAITSHRLMRLRGSSPVVGSSRNRMVGATIRLAPRSSRRRIPPE